MVQPSEFSSYLWRLDCSQPGRFPGAYPVGGSDLSIKEEGGVCVYDLERKEILFY